MEPKHAEQLVQALVKAIPWWLSVTVLLFAFSSIITSVALTMIAWSLVTIVKWNFG